MTFGEVMLIATGSILAFEGVIWAVFPSQTRHLYSQMLREMDDRALHIGGLVSVALGVAILAFALKAVT